MAEATKAPVEEPAAEAAGEPAVDNAPAVDLTAGGEESTAPPAVAVAEVDVDAVEEEPTVAAVEEDVAGAGE